jgi:DNA-directed RNA polymerase omega subunit
MSEEIAETTAEDAETAPPADSKYRLIIVAARRSKQLQRGARARVDADPKRKLTRVAMEEVKAGKIEYSVIEDH